MSDNEWDALVQSALEVDELRIILSNRHIRTSSPID
jgi:hypothetical protein